MHTNATPANDARPAARRSRRRRSTVARRARRWLPLLAGMAVLLACGVVSRHFLPVKSIPGPLFSCVMSESAHEFQRRQPLPYRVSMYFADVLAVGESRVMAGIAPPAFSETLGLRVVNCAAATGYGGQLDRLLDSIKSFPPRKMILALSPGGFYNNDAPPNPASTWTLSRHVFDHTLDLAANRLVSRVIPQVRVPDGTDFELKPFFLAPLQGWTPRYPTSLFPNASDKGYQITLSVDVQKRNTAADKLGPVIDEMRRKGWQIVCVRLPISPSLFAVEDAAYPATKFGTWCAAHDLPYLDYSRAAYDTLDGSHLPAPEALRFSRQLARDLRDRCGW